jgi:hypothetical protein
MATLWTFGDSFTAPYDPTFEWANKYIKWKGYIPKVFPEVMSEELGYDLKNKAVPGSSNQSILEAICDSVDYIKSGDVVIVGWSLPVRFRLVNQYDNWQDILPQMLSFNKVGDVSTESIVEILDNRTHKKYCNEVNSWIKLINKSVKDCTIIHWKHHSENIKVESLRDCQNINEETSGEINDGHYSENGHILLAKRLIEILNSKNKKRLI